jgi:hypothetical protein
VVYINTEFWGVYSNVESVDNSFVDKHFGKSSGAFVKCNPTSLKLNGENSNLSDNPGMDTADYYDLYEMRSDNGWADFYMLIDKLNNAPNDIESILNVDRTLWMHAFNYSLVNFDSYVGYAQNYYLYQDNSGLFNPILWDLNQSFGSFRLTDASNFFRGFTPEEAKTIDPLAHHNSVSVQPRPLMRNLFENDQYRRMYLAHIRAIMQDNFADGSYKSTISDLHNLIDADVARDSNKFYEYKDFINNKDTTVQDLVDYPGITDLMDARSEYLLAYPGIKEMGAPVITVPITDTNLDSIFVSTEVVTTDDVYLYYRTRSDLIFSRIEMMDEGNDEYAVVLPDAGSYLEYYIYAESDSAGTFSPSNAAYNFYVLEPTKTLVINEFCASNETLIEDENGQFEDWIELYNNSDASINLSSYHLSDEVGNLTQWQFPNESIGPNEYRIVWADNDEEDGSLHTNFKLSGSGDAIYLSQNGTIIDQVIFGGQATDFTFGRYPNGTGPFVLMEATPSAFNGGRRLKVESKIESSVTVFPNPIGNKFFVESDINGSAVLLNMQGQVVLTDKITKGLNSLNTTSLASGFYILNISNSSTQISKKIIKQ